MNEDTNVERPTVGRTGSNAWGDCVRPSGSRSLSQESQPFRGGDLQRLYPTIGRFEPSSKTCGECGKVNDALKLSDRVWTCTCGTTHDRDLLAANNIKRFALHPRNKILARDTSESTLEECVV
jgi:hypothetical protein